MVLSFESPDLWSPSGRTSEGAAATEEDAGDEFVLVANDDCEDVEIADDARDDRLEETDVADDREVELTETEADEALDAVLVARVLAGLLEPPYVHPSPNGIEGP